MVDLSIVIANYNGKNLIQRCLRSIYDNTQKVTFEILVIYNNSQDNSARVIKESFPQVKLIENETNRGFTKAANQGLREGKGR